MCCCCCNAFSLSSADIAGEVIDWPGVNWGRSVSRKPVYGYTNTIRNFMAFMRRHSITSTKDSRFDAELYSGELIDDFFSMRSDVDDVIAVGAGTERSVSGEASWLAS